MKKTLHLFLLIAILGAPALGADTSEDRHPVLLRKTLLLPPYESAGTGLAPEVKVKVWLDRRGAVSKVDVLEVSPSSELDEVFKRRSIEDIETWRWAPAIENGEAVATTLEWTVQFQPQKGDGIEAGGDSPLPPAVDLQLRFDRRSYLHELPTAKKQEILKGYARIAEKYLDRAKRQQFDSPRFVVVTDADHPDTARLVAGNLEAAFQQVGTMHRPEIEPLPHKLKTLVYLYRTRTAFNSMRAELYPFAQQRGTYFAPGLIIYFLEVPSSEFLLSFLIHEASHAYSDHHMRRSGVNFPRWFEEGFAEYVANSEIKDGRLVPGGVRKRKYAFDFNHFGGAVRLKQTVAGQGIDTVKRKARRGEWLTLRELFDATPVSFYGEDFPIHYGTAWLFVHFLRHGREEWQDGRFSSFVLYLTEGYSDESALKTVYGASLEELEKPFLDYIKRL